MLTAIYLGKSHSESTLVPLAPTKILPTVYRRYRGPRFVDARTILSLGTAFFHVILNVVCFSEVARFHEDVCRFVRVH